MFAGKKILIAESYNVARDFLKEKLLDKKYEVETAEDGKEVLPKIQNFLPDIVILDIAMPSIGGLEILKEIKEDKLINNIPVIMSLNIEDKGEIDSIKNLGADDYFTKINFDPREVSYKIKNILEQKEIEKERENRPVFDDYQIEEDLDKDYFREDKIKEDALREVEKSEYLEEEKDDEFETEENDFVAPEFSQEIEKTEEVADNINQQEEVAEENADTNSEDQPEEEKDDEFETENNLPELELSKETENLEDSNEQEENTTSEIIPEKTKVEKPSSLNRRIIFLLLFLIPITAFFFWKTFLNKPVEIQLTEEEKCIQKNSYWHEGECYEDEETFVFLDNIFREKECLKEGMYWHEGECYEDEETFTFLNNIFKEKECLRDGMYFEDGECHEFVE